VRLERGLTVRAAAPHLDRRGAGGLAVGDRVEVSWSPDAAVALLE
jgi:hypothetical protein